MNFSSPDVLVDDEIKNMTIEDYLEFIDHPFKIEEMRPIEVSVLQCFVLKRVMSHFGK